MAILVGSLLLLAQITTDVGQALTSSDSVPPVLEPVVEEVEAPTRVVLTPREYLFSVYPAIARRMACVIQRESRWDPGARNPRSDAAGLAQVIYGTWMSTPQGRRGESRYNAFSNIDGAAWLVTSGGGWRHWAATAGGC